MHRPFVSTQHKTGLKVFTQSTTAHNKHNKHTQQGMAERRTGAAKCVVCGVVLLCCCFIGIAADVHFFVVPIDATSGKANEVEQVEITQNNQVVEFTIARLFQIKAVNTQNGQMMQIFVDSYVTTTYCSGSTCKLSSFFSPCSLLLHTTHTTSHHTAQQVFDLCCV